MSGFLNWLVRTDGDEGAMPSRVPAATIYPFPAGAFDRKWRWRVNLPERHGQRCRVLARGTMNSALIEFEDGVRHVVSRFAFRKA